VKVTKKHQRINPQRVRDGATHAHTHASGNRQPIKGKAIPASLTTNGLSIPGIN
jgi:hypothetical protein